MNNITTNRPAIAIDFKKHRIRIHKQTLYLLGKPEYIQFLVNPAAKVIAIRPVVQSDHLVHRIHWNTKINTKSFEFHSKSLVLSIQQICPDLDNNQIYRVYGDHSADRTLVIFPLYVEEDYHE